MFTDEEILEELASAAAPRGEEFFQGVTVWRLLDLPAEKWCPHCGQVKGGPEFGSYRSPWGPQLQSWCKACNLSRPRRGQRPKAQRMACKRGHPYVDGPPGKAGCRECARARGRAWQRKRRNLNSLRVSQGPRVGPEIFTEKICTL
jgi:hypothetical protein